MSFGFPETAVFYRRLRRDYRCAVSAAGSWIVDDRGKSYLDAAGGAVVANLGHGVAEIADSLAEAARLGYLNGTQFTHRFVEELAAELAEILPGSLGYSYFLSSGSEAVEAAVKLARQIWVERGRPAKWKVIHRIPAYHGNTLGALSLSGRQHYRRVFEPLLIDFPSIPAPDTYRHPDSKASTGEILAEEIARQDPETVAAFIAEPIIGSSAGAMVPGQDYYRRVLEICREHEILFIADEVLTGMGRTGRWLACNHYDLVPDLLVLGKGLNGGVAPLSAVVTTRQILATLAGGSGYFNHAQTYSHTPVICAAGLATVRYLKRERLVERCASKEALFFTQLEKLRELRIVGDIRGKGLLAGIELVADRETKRPFERDRRICERFTDRAFEKGLIVWPNFGHVDGERGDTITLAPPLNVADEEIVEIVERCRRTLRDLEDEDA